jgi:hypothetical protein
LSPTKQRLSVQIINHIKSKAEHEKFISKHKDGQKSFSRDRFFSFKVLLVFLMTNLAKSIQRELSLFKDAIELDGGSIPEVSKSAFCRARKKLRHTAFIELNDVILEDFYASDEVTRWHGHRIIAVDGSTHELPNSEEIKEHYGVFQYREDGKAICMARSLMVYDALNHLTLYGDMSGFKSSETAMLWKGLPTLNLHNDDILVFDRYYASHLLLFYLRKLGVQFCFRMTGQWHEIQRFCKTGKDSDIINIGLPIRDRAKAAELGIEEVRCKCRLVSIKLESGETELLLTSLTNEKEFTVESLKELYGLRWSVEDVFKTFKHKVCIENFSGKSVKAVLQDFYVKIFIMNLTAVMVSPINEALKKPTVKVKYTYQVNFTEALATMKRGVVSFFLTNEIAKALSRLYNRLFRTTQPVRPGRKFKRTILKKRKHYFSYKST